MKSKIEQLLEKSILDILTDEEKAELEAWRHENEAHEALYRQLHDAEFLRLEYRRRQSIDHLRPLHDMERRISAAHGSVTAKPSMWKRWAVAASVVLILATSVALWQQFQPAEEAEPVAVISSMSQIHPGETMAVLTTADNTQIAMSDNAAMENVTPKKTVKKPSATSAAAQQEVRYNRLDTPRGAEFHIELEDGTEVWLNSETQLLYPETFGETERRVKVVGEAYFKVAKDTSKPFLVESGGQEVRVYGTEFNVRDYPEDECISTVLVEGSVALSRIKNPDNSLLLTPGRQVLFDKATEEASISPVNVELMTSWRSGQFVFENQSLRHIMIDLARWYNFEFEFADESVAETLFMGSMPRYADFEQVLTILEKSGGLTFTLVKGKVMIRKS